MKKTRRANLLILLVFSLFIFQNSNTYGDNSSLSDIPNIPVQAIYSDLIEISEIYFNRRTNLSMKGETLEVEFKIKNKGDRTLKEVEVTVYFKDALGTIIAEKSYHPVLVTKYSFSGGNKPLKPNYIWQMEGGKFYKADSVPSEWKEGVVSAKIANIEFE